MQPRSFQRSSHRASNLRMFPPYALFNLAAMLSLWLLSLLGGVVVLLSWFCVEPEYDETIGVLTRGGCNSVRARALLTLCCIVFWICTLIGYVIGSVFEFWQRHPTSLITISYLVEPFLFASVFFAWKSRGRATWILLYGSSILVIADTCVLVYLSTA